MSEPRLVLVGVAVLLEAPQDEDAMHDRMSVVSEALRAAARQVAASRPDCKSMDMISYHYLGENDENAARCSYCGRWASDWDKPNPIDGLAVGFVLDGLFLCDQCRVWRHNGGVALPE
jgi:hypothetical protein